MYIVWTLFVFEDVRLSLEGEAETLHARGHEANCNSKLHTGSLAIVNGRSHLSSQIVAYSYAPCRGQIAGPHVANEAVVIGEAGTTFDLA